MKRNLLKKVMYVGGVILCICMIGLSVVYATSESDLRNQQSELDDKIKATHTEIDGVKSQMSEALTQISRLNSQIDTYETEIGELETQISTLNTQISEKETALAEQEQKYAEQQKLLNERLVAMYESGSSSYLDMLLSADSLADLISKYYMISQLAEYDQELLQRIEATKNQIDSEKQQLESNRQEVSSSKEKVEVRRNSLDVVVKDKNTLVNNLTEEEKALNEQLEEFEKDKKKVEAELASLAKKNNRTVAVAPSAAGYISPLAGKTKANITTRYGSYSWGGNHTGVDFACSGGTPILAVKAGIVVTSTALKTASGNYKSYGEYVVIDHEDGTMTLYAHGQPGSRLVSVNQRVSQGQQIMSVGTTGNSTGNHLHFEVFAGGKRTNPTAYLP